MLLKAYMKIRKINSSNLAKEMGTSRQNIDNWCKEEAEVELMDSSDTSDHSVKNIKITREVFPRVLHETQVRK